MHTATGSMQHANEWDKGTVMEHVIVPAVMQAAKSSPPNADETLGFVASCGTIDPSADGRSTILFCDDDPANIRDVRGACESCATLFVPRRRHESGLQVVHMAAIREWAGIEVEAPLAASAASLDADGEVAHRESPQPPPLRGKRSRDG